MAKNYRLATTQEVLLYDILTELEKINELISKAIGRYPQSEAEKLDAELKAIASQPDFEPKRRGRRPKAE